MLSRKYYRIFAQLLATSKDMKEAQFKMEDFFKEDNPRFDVFTFRNAIAKAEGARLAQVI